MWRLIKDTVFGFMEDEALSRGAAIAFYTVTSLAPVLLIVVSIAGLVFGQEAAQGAILSQLTGLMGQQAADVLQSALASASEKSSGIVATVIGVVTLLATASGVFGEMQAALNRIWKAEPKSGTFSRLVRARAASLGLVAALGFLLAVSLVVSAGLTALGTSLNAILPFGAILLSVVNFLVSFLLLALLFAAIYKVLPDRPIAWRDVVMGAAVTALLFTIGKSLIGWYLGSSAVASSYGAAGGLIVLFFWVYYSTQVFLLGAEFTRAYATSRGRGPVVAPAQQAAARAEEKAQAAHPASAPAAAVEDDNDNLTPLQRAEREASRSREALVRTVTALEHRLSPAHMKRVVVRSARRRPVCTWCRSCGHIQLSTTPPTDESASSRHSADAAPAPIERSPARKVSTASGGRASAIASFTVSLAKSGSPSSAASRRATVVFPEPGMPLTSTTVRGAAEGGHGSAGHSARVTAYRSWSRHSSEPRVVGMSRYDGEKPSRRNPIPRSTPAERTLAGWTLASSRCRPIPRGSWVNATSTTRRSPSANSPRPAYGSKASYPRVPPRARPRTTLVTLTFPTRSWSPSECLAWMSRVRW